MISESTVINTSQAATVTLRDKVNDDDLADTVVIAVLSGFIVLPLAVLYVLSRVGFAIDARPVISSAGLIFFLIAMPPVLRSLLARAPYNVGRAWTLTNVAFVLYALALLTAAGLFTRVTGFAGLLPIFSGAGLLMFAYVLVLFVRLHGFSRKLSWVSGGLVIGFFLAAQAWGNGYQTPVFLEGLAVGATGHRDTLFHAAIAGMLRTYDTVSMGVDGLVLLDYHYGSHWLFAVFSDLLDVAVLDFYQLGYPVIFLPLLVYSLLLASLDLRPYLVPARMRLAIRADTGYWLVFIVAIFGVPGIIPYLFIGSESYDLGLLLLALVMPLAARALWVVTRSPVHAIDAMLVVLVLPIMAVIGGLFKASILYLLGILGVYVLLRLRLYRRVIGWLAAAVMVVTITLIYPAGQSAPTTEGFSPNYLLERLAGLEIFIPFAFAWLYIGLRLYQRRVRAITDLLRHWRKRSLLDVELMLVLVVVSTGALILLQLGGRAEFYIFDVQRWVALILLLAAWPMLVPTRLDLRPDLRAFPRRLRLRDLGLFLAGGFYAVSVLAMIALQFDEARVDNRRVRAGLVNAAPVERPDSLWRTDMTPYLKNNLNINIIRALERIGTQPRDERKDALLYISRSHAYWRIQYAVRSDRQCSTRPLMAPALTGMAQLDGIPPADCVLTAPGYSNYYAPYLIDGRFQPTLPPDADTAAICAVAEARGFAEVWVLNHDLSTSVIECD